MGSKSPEGHRKVPDAPNAPLPSASSNAPKISPNFSQSADLGQGVIGDEDDDDDDDDSKAETGLNITVDVEKKKKRKRSKKKKKTKSGACAALLPSECPAGELVPYENTSRTTDEETRYNSRLWDEGFLADYRQAAEIHRQARQYAQKDLIKPGASLQSIAEAIEDRVRTLSDHQGVDTGDCLKAGMGFPTGLCLNNIAAHWTPNPGGKDVILDKSDVLSVDFGVHVNGRIVDSAFTVAFDPAYDNLLASVKEATNTGISHAGVDARISDIGAAIQEVMESYEVEIGGKLFPVKAIRTISGHDILRYQIHGNKQVPFIKNDNPDKMEEGEVFAIETFGTTGSGYLYDDVGVYGYGRNAGVSGTHLRLPSAKSLLQTIDNNFGTLPFCRRYLERLGVSRYHLAMKNLVDNDIVESYAPLIDVKGSYTAQFEHTILLHSGGKEVISRGEDY